MGSGMRRLPKRQNIRPSQGDYQCELDQQGCVGTRPRPALRSQMITTLKLLTVAAVALLALWYLDQMLAG